MNLRAVRLTDARDGVEDRLFDLGLREHSSQFVAFESMFGNHLVDERAHVFAIDIDRRRGVHQAETYQCPGEKSCNHQCGSNFLCECIDIRIPNPAISVTMEVPPNDTSGNGTPTTGTRPVTIAVFTKT